jgi:hypothetical protein
MALMTNVISYIIIANILKIIIIYHSCNLYVLLCLVNAIDDFHSLLPL